MRGSGTGSFIGQIPTEEELTRKTQCTPKIAITTTALLAASTLSTISFKTQSSVYNFKHGIFQTILMFLGEYINLFIFFLIMVASLYLMLIEI